MPHRRSGSPPASPPDPADTYSARLGQVKPVHHEAGDERPSREERAYGRSPFESAIPVPLPKFLRPKKQR